MQEQRARAKADARSRKGAIADQSVYREFRALGETVFTGYTDLQTESKVLGILVDGRSTDRASQGQIAEVVLAETALYAESGGQVADKGVIVGPGYELEVLDVQRPVPGLISHTVEVTTGEVSVDAPATTVVDALNRHSAQQAHSATHLVHAAIRDTLGKTATQTGSLNRAGYMRFDFSWGAALSPETRTEIEDIANNAVRDNLEVTTRVLSLDEAKAAGAMALFGEKYGDTVRMVDIGGPWSRELCGGTHVARSAEIGLVNLVGESSVGASNRRVEALVGLDAFRDLAAERAIVSQLTSSLKTPREQLTTRIAELAASLKAAEKKIAAFEARALSDRLPQLVESAASVGTVRVVAQSLGEGASADDVRTLALQVRDRLGSDAAVVALGTVAGGRATVVVVTNDAARERGLAAAPWPSRPPVCSAAAAAVVPTSPRAAERMRRPCRRRSRASSRTCGRSRRDGVPPRHPTRHRCGTRARRRRAIGPRRSARGARGDGAAQGRAGAPHRRPRGGVRGVRSARRAAPEPERRRHPVDDGRPSVRGELAAALPVPVRLVDERLSTVSAHGVLRQAGRSQRDSRSIVDQVAAVVLLQQALDVERQSGEPAGPAVSPGQEPA